MTFCCGSTDVVERMLPGLSWKEGQTGTSIFQRLFKADSLEAYSPSLFRHPRRQKIKVATRSPKVPTKNHGPLQPLNY
jgi:hypothetical protein